MASPAPRPGGRGKKPDAAIAPKTGLADEAGLGFWQVALYIVVALTLLRLAFLRVSPLEFDPAEASRWLWSRSLAWGYGACYRAWLARPRLCRSGSPPSAPASAAPGRPAPVRRAPAPGGDRHASGGRGRHAGELASRRLVDAALRHLAGGGAGLDVARRGLDAHLLLGRQPLCLPALAPRRGDRLGGPLRPGRGAGDAQQRGHAALPLRRYTLSGACRSEGRRTVTGTSARRHRRFDGSGVWRRISSGVSSMARRSRRRSRTGASSRAGSRTSWSGNSSSSAPSRSISCCARPSAGAAPRRPMAAGSVLSARRPPAAALPVAAGSPRLSPALSRSAMRAPSPFRPASRPPPMSRQRCWRQAWRSMARSSPG